MFVLVLFALSALLNVHTVLHVYPSLFLGTAAIQTTLGLLSLLTSWSQTVRDKEFLVEMRLRNHDPNEPVVQSYPEDA